MSTSLDFAQEAEHRVLEGTAAKLPRPISVLIVDDHVLVRSAINQLLTSQPEVECIVLAPNYAEAEVQASQLCPDIIWLDVHIGHSTSIGEIGRLRKLAPASHILALADVEDEQEAFAAIMAGAQGYRSKQDVNPAEIMPMIHTLYRGEFVLSPRLLMRLMQRLITAALPLWGSEDGADRYPSVHLAASTGLAQLTIRECEILQSISQGYRDREIARGLYISEKTVHKHVQSILNKLGVQNRTEAAYFLHSQQSAEQR